MSLKTSGQLAGLAALIGLAALGCGRMAGPLTPWPLPTDPIAFQDQFTGLVNFEAFGNSKLDALGTDAAEQYLGSGCIKITVPDAGVGYAGGAFVATQARNLSGYNALTFYAKASKVATLDVAGFGNDNTGTSKFTASRSGFPLQTFWQKYVIPIPLPSKLAAERGMFFFSASVLTGTGYTLWFDEMRFEYIPTISKPRPAMTPLVLNSIVGATLSVTGTRDTFNVSGTDQVVSHFPGYFTFASSDPTVATVTDGAIRLNGAGSAKITAKLDTTSVAGVVTVNAGPFTPGLAPTPTLPRQSGALALQRRLLELAGGHVVGDLGCRHGD